MRTVQFVQPALVNGAVGVVMAPRGRLFRVLSFTRGKIVEVDVIADPVRLGQLDLAAASADILSQLDSARQPATSSIGD
jgi:hypothetical protein